MRRLFALLCLLILVPAPALAQVMAPPVPFNPASEYVTVGQDEPGYRRWVAAASWRPMYVRAFHNYLVSNGVAGVAPTWQLLRTATAWRHCGAEPFEVPPTSEWANIVATLNYIGTYIVPVMGPVEPVSVYRNPTLNVCAGGAEASTHREMGAVDMVPLRPISREALMSGLCAIHLSTARTADAGLGFYKGIRFHIDARKHREWGTAGAHGGYGCAAVLAEGALPFNTAPTRATLTPVVAAPPIIVSSPPTGIIVSRPAIIVPRQPMIASPPAPATAPPADPLAPTEQ